MNPTNKEIIELIKGVQKGDRHSGKQLYESFAMYILTICKRYYVDTELLKDYMQEIFSQCFSSLNRYDADKGEFKYWLRKIAINYILKRKNKKAVLEHAVDVELISLSEPAKSELNMQDILSILKRMPEKYAVIFNLFVIDGYSNKEISDMLDLNENTVRSYVKRGRDWARENIEANYLNDKIMDYAKH